jgi:tRNA-dihydrouridine synthase B
LRNPFLFEQARALWFGTKAPAVDAERYVNLILEQKGLLADSFAERAAMIHARKFLAWYSSGFPGCHEFRSKVFSIPEPAVLWDEARRFFENATRDRDMKFLQQPFLMGGHG